MVAAGNRIFPILKWRISTVKIYCISQGVVCSCVCMCEWGTRGRRLGLVGKIIKYLNEPNFSFIGGRGGGAAFY